MPPHAPYRTFDTPHFTVVYAEGLEEVALRAAAHSEEAHRVLREGFLPPPEGRIELLVTDHSDLSNGFARSTPRPRVTLWVRPPMDATALSHFDDWLGLVSMHELAHVFHLERTGRLGGALRRVFGRVPTAWPFFPAHLLPTWAIEGVAVQVESAHTDGGRLHGTLHAAIVRAQALEGRTESLGQALGSSPVWPGGVRPYVYGSLFLGWVEDRYGPGSVATFLEGSANQWIPFRLNAAARGATGRSLEELWEEWSEEVEAEMSAAVAAGTAAGTTTDWAAAAADTAAAAAAPPARPRGERLTHGARNALYPAPDPSGSGDVVYLRSDGRSDTRLVLREPDGTERTLTRWNDLSRPVWTGEGHLLATQPEYVDRWQLRQDLHRIHSDGRVERLTRGLRISHVDAHPHDGRIAAVQEGGGTNRLLLLTPAGGVERILHEADPEVHWAFPRWSPGGDLIAAVRWRRGGHTAIVLLDPGGSFPPRVVVEDRSLHTAPAWTPDGDRLLWSSDRDGGFNIFARGVDANRPRGALLQVTRSAAGATHPSVDPGGAWIYHSTLGADGWDLARIPFEPDSWHEPAPPHDRFVPEAARPDPPPAPIVVPDRPWSALPSLLPTYWFPVLAESQSVRGRRVLPWAIGAETSGRDLVGRHGWSLSAKAPPTDPAARLEVAARWRWSGLGQPSLLLRADQRFRTLSFIAPAAAPGDTLYPVGRERVLGVDAEFHRQRVRSVVQFTAGVREVRDRRTLLEADGEESTRFHLTRPDRRLGEVVGGIGLSTVRSYPFSVSPARGVGVTLRGRHRRDLAVPDSLAGEPRADGSFDEVLVAGRGFLSLPLPRPVPAFSPATFGVRGAFGAAAGPGAGAGHFRVGGGGGGGEGTAGFTRDASNPTFSVRGLPRGVVGGDRAWAASAELRLPLANLHRGAGALPLHLDRMAGAVFFDIAGAGRPGTGEDAEGGRVWDRRSSVGVEATLMHTLFFQSPSQLRAGLALPLGGEGRPTPYLQTRWSF